MLLFAPAARLQGPPRSALMLTFSTPWSTPIGQIEAMRLARAARAFHASFAPWTHRHFLFTRRHVKSRPHPADMTFPAGGEKDMWPVPSPTPRS